MITAKEKAEEIVKLMKSSDSHNNKSIDFYRPSTYSKSQLEKLSTDGLSSYIEKVMVYNTLCDILGLPEKQMKIGEF